MKTALIVGLGMLTTTAIVAIFMKLRTKRKTLKRIADEGYETAVDMFAPNTFFKNLKYGPTLPS